MALVRILEQPAREIRYRYYSERHAKSSDDDSVKNGRATVGIPGVHSNPPDKRTHPSIMIEGYKGWAAVQLSCVVDVDENGRYRPHPHELVGPDCKDGFFHEWLNVTDDKHVKVFDNINLRCVKKKDARDALELRRKNGVDPFRTGISHARDLKSINLGAIRLCFEVFIHEADKLQPLPPLVSDVILDTKKLSKLQICYCSHTSAPVTGADTNIFLLCNKVMTEKINVVFFETGADGEIEWQAIIPSEFVFQHVAVAVKVPPYKDPQSLFDHDVRIKLCDSSDDSRSTTSYPFKYTGIYPDPKWLPQEGPQFVTFNTRYGPILTRKRAKPMYWIPPELYGIPTTYKFQTKSIPETAVPSTSTRTEFTNSSTQENPSTIDRFYSVPGTSSENRLFHRKSSCPGSYFTGNHPTTSISSTSSKITNANIGNAAHTYGNNSFSEYNSIPGTNTEVGAIIPTTSSSVNSNVNCISSENMDINNGAATFENQLVVPGASSAHPLVPIPNTDLLHSSIENFIGLPSMADLMSHLKSVQNDQENIPEDPIPEFVNSPNFPDFDVIT